MRPKAVALAAMLVTVVAVGWLWGRNRDEGAPPPVKETAQAHVASESNKVIRGTPETTQAWLTLDAQTHASYGFDVWREPSCNGVVVFYHPHEEGEEVSWHWFDLHSEQIVEQATLAEVIQALNPHLEGFKPDTPRFMIGQLNTPQGRPLYSIGIDKSGGTVQIGFSPNRCSALPDIAHIMRGKEASPINIDLPAAVERVREGQPSVGHS